MKRKGGLGFLPSFLTGRIDGTSELAFMARLNLKNAVVYDIGAFEGILTLFLSRQAKRVVAYEPNPDSHRRLLENLRLNNVGNVTVRNVAVGDHEGSIAMIYDRLMAGGATGDAEVAGQISRTSRRTKSVTVDVISLDLDLSRDGLPAPDFIKIDIEGMELPALQGMTQTLSRYRPALYIEMHGATRVEKERGIRRIVEFLHGQGYTDILHVESGLKITCTNLSLGCEGHLYCPPPNPPNAPRIGMRDPKRALQCGFSG